MDSLRRAIHSMTRFRSGFTLLEIVISLAILAVSLAVLVESEAGAVMLTVDAQRTLTANTLAEQTMAEVLLAAETEGISESDQYGEGEYSDFGSDGQFGQADFTGEYDEFSYAWTVRKVDMQIGDAAQAITDLQEMGVSPSGNEQQQDNSMDASMLSAFMSPEMLNEMLSPWMREVRVVVWWGEDPGDLESDLSCESCVELVTHIFNPSGQMMGADGESTSDSSSTTSSSSSSTSTTSKPKGGSSTSSPRGGGGIGGGGR